MSERDVGSVDGLGLADAIALLRDELLRARAAGATAEIQLPVDSMTVQLTATHVVAEAEKVQVRDPDKNLYPASVNPSFIGDSGGPGPDLALVEIDDETLDLPPLGLARVDRDSPAADPVERCHAIGYPWF